MLKKVLKIVQRKENGFTLLELLVVIAILGTIAAIAIPNIVKFMDSGREEAYDTEKDNVQTAITTMLYESGTHQIGPDSGTPGACGPTNDMDLITTADSPQLKLSSYMLGLKSDGTTALEGVTYTVDLQGHVEQTHP